MQEHAASIRWDYTVCIGRDAFSAVSAFLYGRSSAGTRTICHIAIKFDEAILLCSPMARNSRHDTTFGSPSMGRICRKNASCNLLKKFRIFQGEEVYCIFLAREKLPYCNLRQGRKRVGGWCILGWLIRDETYNWPLLQFYIAVSLFSLLALSLPFFLLSYQEFLSLSLYLACFLILLEQHGNKFVTKSRWRMRLYSDTVYNRWESRRRHSKEPRE